MFDGEQIVAAIIPARQIAALRSPAFLRCAAPSAVNSASSGIAKKAAAARFENLLDRRRRHVRADKCPVLPGHAACTAAFRN